MSNGINQGCTQVATYENILSPRFEHFTDQGRDRRLTIGSCNGDHGSAQFTPGDFNFAEDRDSLLTTEVENRNVERHAWADDNQVCVAKEFSGMPTEIQPDA